MIRQPGNGGNSKITIATPTDINGLLKGNGSTVAKAVDGTDYLTPSGADTKYLKLTGGTMSGPIDMSNNRVTNLATPSQDNDAVSREFVKDALTFYHLKTKLVSMYSGYTVIQFNASSEVDVYGYDYLYSTLRGNFFPPISIYNNNSTNVTLTAGTNSPAFAVIVQRESEIKILSDNNPITLKPFYNAFILGGA